MLGIEVPWQDTVSATFGSVGNGCWQSLLLRPENEFCAAPLHPAPKNQTPTHSGTDLPTHTHTHTHTHRYIYTDATTPASYSYAAALLLMMTEGTNDRSDL